jgi:hypothetical protein
MKIINHFAINFMKLNNIGKKDTNVLVAECHIDVDSVEILILYQKFLVDFSSLFEMAPQVVQRSHAKLIFNGAGQSSMQVHNFVLIA